MAPSPASPAAPAAPSPASSAPFGYINDIFYRADGHHNPRKMLLLHGYPTSSLMFRTLIPRLAHRYHLVAPDLPGFGFSRQPGPHTFASIAAAIVAFVDALAWDKFELYVFDYGAPTGFRLLLAHPERIARIVTQNGNMYEEGLGAEFWAPVRELWAGTDGAAELLRGIVADKASTDAQYLDGATRPVDPAPAVLDHALLLRDLDAQVALFRDYASNVALYPQFQRAVREHRVPVLAVWGQNDAIFVPAGAHAFRRDAPDCRVVLLPAGHFALETHAAEIAHEILRE
ncbi:hypothetical protein OGAPHI_001333 [Ogataea philodendri]|uniref:AB hydrolase-1 domain-containing protein n=1 Tax=Ogataea philodendri TaxID=1378263 RepID=A0A9P8PC11_9ASCO|nr:uncharacterized protein OGAPHI_001333 [Ogataea philodendri]KAH3669212.1 hypothetical protein OGAPHI_001333 [Ogataea philodendri]